MASSNTYVIYCVDAPCDTFVADPNGGPRRVGAKRMSCMDEHNAYQMATSSPNHECCMHKIAAVPMLAQDGVTIIGSSFLVQAPREDCERFVHSDPFFLNQVWESVSINKFSGAGKPQAPASQKKTTAGPIQYRSQRV